MGIHGLTKLLREEAPECIKEHEMKNYTGRKVAIDASMCIYQFMFAVRQSGENGVSQNLTNEAGEVTSHIQGMFNRTIRLLATGLKPVYVFDGKPPTLKGGELAKRKERREQAAQGLKDAKEAGNAEDIDKFNKRLIRVTTQHNEDCKQLLKLMGVPVINAPMEAEAQCAQLARDNLVFAAGTEDMDTLTFQTPVLLRHLTSPLSQKQPILEIHHDKILEGLGLTAEQFVDVCIMCGCDYCGTIKGIGPKSALKGIKQYKNIETYLKHIDKKKYPVPADWLQEDPIYAQARELFVNHLTFKKGESGELMDVGEGAEQKPVEMKWEDCDEKGLTEFLVDKWGFNADRVQTGIEKLKKSKQMASQKRMDSFFTRVKAPEATNKKRKVPPKKGKAGKKKAKKGNSGFARR